MLPLASVFHSGLIPQKVYDVWFMHKLSTPHRFIISLELQFLSDFFGDPDVQFIKERQAKCLFFSSYLISFQMNTLQK